MQIPYFTSSWKHGNIKYSRQEHFFPISAKWISEVHPLLLHFIIKCRYYKLLCSFNLLHFQGRCLLSEMIEQEKPKSSNFSCFGRQEHLLEYFSANVWIRWFDTLLNRAETKHKKNVPSWLIIPQTFYQGEFKPQTFYRGEFKPWTFYRGEWRWNSLQLLFGAKALILHLHCFNIKCSAFSVALHWTLYIALKRTAFLHSCCR